MPGHAPVQMGPGGTPGGADAADHLALRHDVTGFHLQLREVHHCREQPAAVINDDQIAFQHERPSRQPHHTGDGCLDRRAVRGGDVHAAVIAGRDVAIDALRAKMRGDAPRGRPLEGRAPEWPGRGFGAGSLHLRHLGLAPCFIFQVARRVGVGRWIEAGGQAIDHPLTARHHQITAGTAAILRHPLQRLGAGKIAVHTQHEAAIAIQMHRLPIQSQIMAAGGERGDQQLALHGRERLGDGQRQRRGRTSDGGGCHQNRQGQMAHHAGNMPFARISA